MPSQVRGGQPKSVPGCRADQAIASHPYGRASRPFANIVRIAFYGRFSSDNQKETSISDQLRIVQRWALQHGHKIISEFSDEAMSGASLKLLAGLQRALDAAATSPAPFDAIAVDQLSRLSRDVGDTDAIIKRLRFIGVSVVAVSDNINTADETTKISVIVKSLVNELYLDDLKKTTKRGLDGQFLKGYSTGGRTYGYRTEPVSDPSPTGGKPVPAGYRIEVDSFEAVVVRRIFASFRDGSGEKAIAKQLNADQTGRLWRSNTVFHMLQNQKYVGRFTFNRREWVKNPATGRRAFRWRPPEQWEVRQSEDLRIVDDNTWKAVQQRLRTRNRLFARGRSRTKHLLSGLLFCDRCGGCLSVVGKDCYGCRNHAESGSCSNSLRVHRASVEQVVLSELARYLEVFVHDLSRAATQIFQTGDPADSESHQRLAKLRQQAEGIMGAIKSSTLSGRALEEAMAAYQEIWDQIQTVELEPHSPSSPPVTELRYDRSVVNDFISRLPETLRVNVDLGREFLREVLEQIRISPTGQREILCPLCGKHLGKLAPQHLAKHGLGREETHRRFPQLGFSGPAQLSIQPRAAGLLGGAKVDGLTIAGRGIGLSIPENSDEFSS